MSKKKIGIIALLALAFAGAGFFWWSQGSAERAQEKMDLAVKYISENNFEKAILAYDEAIKIDSKAADAYMGLAKVYALQGQYEEAQATYKKGLAKVESQDKNMLQLGLGGMYIDQGQTEEAKKSFQEIIEGNPACLEAYWGLAIVYQQQGDNSQAEEILRQAVVRNPNEYRSYNMLALFLSQNGERDQAFENLVKSISLQINQQEAYLVLKDLFEGDYSLLSAQASGVSDQRVADMLILYSYFAAQDYQNAVNTFDSKLSDQADNHKAQILAAIALGKTGNAGSGQELIDQLANKKVDGWLLSDIAEYYLAAGDKEKARLTAINALEAHSTNLEAVALLQRLNTNDEDGKIYTAAFLLYNWKPVKEVENILSKAELKLSFTTPDASVIAYVLTNYPEIQESDLRSYYDINRFELTGDKQSEIIVSGGGKFGNAFVLQPRGESYRVLLREEGYVYSTPNVDKYGNLVLNLAFTGTGTLEEKHHIFRWNGSNLREIWSGVVNHYNCVELVGSDWCEETGSYTINGNKNPEHLKYILKGKYGHVVEFGKYDIVDREETITKEYTFDENQFKFVETSSESKEKVTDEKLALLKDVAEWANIQFRQKPQLEPPYGNPGGGDFTVGIKEMNGNSATVWHGEYASDNGGLSVFKRNAAGKWIFDHSIETDI